MSNQLICLCISDELTRDGQDEKRPMLVRLWYCDIGIRGNVPNWTVREKLLDKFLVGGKPVPDRVLDVSESELIFAIVRPFSI